MCGGSGTIGHKRNLSPILKEAHFKEATRLRRDGCTLRQIAAYLGYTHPQTVKNLLNAKKSKP